MGDATSLDADCPVYKFNLMLLTFLIRVNVMYVNVMIIIRFH